MNSELTNQTAIIIGGTSGMGLAIAHLAKTNGARVIVGSRSPDKVAAAVAEIGAEGYVIDTMDESSVREFFGLFVVNA